MLKDIFSIFSLLSTTNVYDENFKHYLDSTKKDLNFLIIFIKINKLTKNCYCTSNDHKMLGGKLLPVQKRKIYAVKLSTYKIFTASIYRLIIKLVYKPRH